MPDELQKLRADVALTLEVLRCVLRRSQGIEQKRIRYVQIGLAHQATADFISG
jgi:hypothetical protein